MKNKKKQQDEAKPYPSHKLHRASAYLPFCSDERI